MPDIHEYEKMPLKAQTCPAIGSQEATVCLPISVSPYAVTGPAMIECCGAAKITNSCNRCPGKTNANCEFTISQKIRVEIPVEFGATVNVGETYVDCGCAKVEGFDGVFDCKCDKEE